MSLHTWPRTVHLALCIVSDRGAERGLLGRLALRPDGLAARQLGAQALAWRLEDGTGCVDLVARGGLGGIMAPGFIGGEVLGSLRPRSPPQANAGFKVDPPAH